jgi:hypothetical protein
MAASPTQTARAAAQATDVELRAAWQALRVPAWPSTFEETMRDPIRSRLITLKATHMVRSAAAHKAYPLRNCNPWHYAISAFQPRQHGQDMKRAAAGDRDED